jgi:hypothetical protein
MVPYTFLLFRIFLTDINQMIKERRIPTSDMICGMKEWEPIPETEELWTVQQPVMRLPEKPKVKPKEPEVKPAADGGEEGKENKIKFEGPFLSQWPPPAPVPGRKTGKN